MRPINGFVGSAVLTLLLAASASADVVHDNYTVKGETLYASWHWVDGCMHTSVSLAGMEQRSRTIGGVSSVTNTLSMEVVRFNHCTFDVIEMWGETNAGGVAIDGTSTGAVDTAITLQGDHCGNLHGTGFGCEDLEPEVLDVHAALTGIGDVSTGRSVYTGRWGSGHSSSRYFGKSRDATATGSLVVDGTELIVGDAYAHLENVTTGTQVITHL